MSALCLLADDMLHICTLQEVFIRSKKYFVKYTDNKKYPARVLAISNNQTFLWNLKSNIEGGAREEIEGGLTLVDASWMNYPQVSKAVTKHTDDDFVFVDTAICPDVDLDPCIRIVVLDRANEQDDFFDNAPKFWEFKMRNSSKDNGNTFSTSTNHQSRRRTAPALSPLIHQKIISAPRALPLKTSPTPHDNKNDDKPGARGRGNKSPQSSFSRVRAIRTPVPEFINLETSTPTVIKPQTSCANHSSDNNNYDQFEAKSQRDTEQLSSMGKVTLQMSKPVENKPEVSEPEEVTSKTQSATITAPTASSTPGVVIDENDSPSKTKCQISEEEVVSAGLNLHETYAENNQRDQVIAYQINCLVVEEEQNDDKTSTLQSSNIANDNNSLSQPESIIVTPSGTPDVSINYNRRKKFNRMCICDDEGELFAKGNVSTVTASPSSSVLEAALKTHHSGEFVETMKDSIDPFTNNVYLTAESSNRCTLHTVDSAVHNGWEKSPDKSSGPTMIKGKSHNCSRYEIEDKESKSTGCVRQSPLVTGVPTKTTHALVDDDQLENPSFCSVTFESDLIKNNDQVSKKTSKFGNENNGQDWDEKEKDDSDENSDPGLHEDKFMAGKKQNNSSVPRSLEITLSHHAFLSAPDDRELEVDKASSGTKKHFCFYCKKLQSKLARHLESVHRKEDEVKKFMALPPRNRERQAIIAKIRKDGDYIYNTDRRFNDGKLIVCRRPNTRKCTTAEDFLCCGNCKGQYVRSDLRQHSQKCTGRTGKNTRVVVANGRKMASRVHARASSEVRTYVYPYMHEDEVVRSIRYDELTTVFANKQCETYSTQKPPYQTIRANLRLLGRFFIEVKKLDKSNCIKDLADVYTPCYYDISIQAVQIIARHNPEQKTFGSPAVASRLSQLLRKVGELQQCECRERGMDVKEKKTEKFLKLLTRDFGTSINSVVAGPQIQNYGKNRVINYEKGPSTSREDFHALFDKSFIHSNSEP